MLKLTVCTFLTKRAAFGACRNFKPVLLPSLVAGIATEAPSSSLNAIFSTGSDGQCDDTHEWVLKTHTTSDVGNEGGELYIGKLVDRRHELVCINCGVKQATVVKKSPPAEVATAATGLHEIGPGDYLSPIEPILMNTKCTTPTVGFEIGSHPNHIRIQRALLLEKYPESSLAKAFHENPSSTAIIQGCPEYFLMVKKFIEEGEIHLPSRFMKKFFLDDLKTYGILGENDDGGNLDITEEEDISLSDRVAAFETRFALGQDVPPEKQKHKMEDQLKLSKSQSCAARIVHFWMTFAIKVSAPPSFHVSVGIDNQLAERVAGLRTLQEVLEVVRKEEVQEYFQCFGVELTKFELDDPDDDHYLAMRLLKKEE